MEAEICVASEAARQAVWMEKLVADLEEIYDYTNSIYRQQGCRRALEDMETS